MLSIDESMLLMDAVNTAENVAINAPQHEIVASVAGRKSQQQSKDWYEKIREIILRETTSEANPDDIKVLTERERQVFDRLIVGATNKKIAAELDISVKTIDTHRGHILKKLGIVKNGNGNVKLILWAIDRKFIVRG